MCYSSKPSLTNMLVEYLDNFVHQQYIPFLPIGSFHENDLNPNGLIKTKVALISDVSEDLWIIFKKSLKLQNIVIFALYLFCKLPSSPILPAISSTASFVSK